MTDANAFPRVAFVPFVVLFVRTTNIEYPRALRGFVPPCAVGGRDWVGRQLTQESRKPKRATMRNYFWFSLFRAFAILVVYKATSSRRCGDWR